MADQEFEVGTELTDSKIFKPKNLVGHKAKVYVKFALN
jgi:hypothetical protein